MPEIGFYGASDDLFEVFGAVEDEYSDPAGEFTVLVAGAEFGALLVHACFISPGTWSVGVAPAGDDSHLPPWPITVRRAGPAECEYSATLVIDVPEGTEVRCLNGEV